MNEGIDMALMGAKIASSKNQAASLTVHALSASYNIAQMARYRALNAEIMNVQPSGGIQDCVDIGNQYRRELLKHTVLTGLDVFSLFMIGLAGCEKR
jgi:hypothetical protein